MKKSSECQGFTLLELIVGIAILTLLAGVLIPLAKSSLNDAKLARVISLIHNLKSAAQRYWMNTDQLPQEIWDPASTHDLFVNNVGSLWKGPYIDQPIAESHMPWQSPVRLVPSRSRISLLSSLTGLGGNGYKIGGANIASGTLGSEIRIWELPIGIAKKFDLAMDGVDSPDEGVCEYIENGPPLAMGEVRIFLFEKK